MESQVDAEHDQVALMKQQLHAALATVDDVSAYCLFWDTDTTACRRYLRATEGNVNKAVDMMLRTSLWRVQIGIHQSLTAASLDLHFRQRKNYLMPKRDKCASDATAGVHRVGSAVYIQPSPVLNCALLTVYSFYRWKAAIRAEMQQRQS